MKRSIVVLALLVPTFGLAQEKFTNADLRRPAKADAYTNADLARLAPLPVGRALKPGARPAAAPAEEVDSLQQVLRLERDLLLAEIGYWTRIREASQDPRGRHPRWPSAYQDAAEAHRRLQRLDSQLFRLEEEMALLR